MPTEKELNQPLTMMKKLLPSFSIAFFLMTSIWPMPAVAATKEIPLAEAMASFYRNNHDILVNRYEIDKAEADLVGAKLLSNPTFSVNYTGLEQKLPPRAADTTQLVVRIDQLIELGGKRDARSNAARETLEAARLTHRDTIRTLLVGFYSIGYGLKLDQLNMEQAEADLKRFDRILEIAGKRFAAGHLSQVDYTKLRLARIDLENSLTTLATQLANDREQFGQLIGSDQPVQPVVETSETARPYNVEELVSSARENRFDLLSLQKQLRAAEQNSALARAGRIPDITVGVEHDSYGRANSPAIGFGVSLNIPLFNQNQGEIQRRKAEYSQLESQKARTIRQIALEIRQAVNSSLANRKVFDAYRSREAEMKELLSRSEQAFTLGGITVLDLLDTQKSFRDFSTRYNQSLVQSNLSEELVKVYTGEVK